MTKEEKLLRDFIGNSKRIESEIRGLLNIIYKLDQTTTKFSPDYYYEIEMVYHKIRHDRKSAEKVLNNKQD